MVKHTLERLRYDAPEVQPVQVDTSRTIMQDSLTVPSEGVGIPDIPEVEFGWS